MTRAAATAAPPAAVVNAGVGGDAAAADASPGYWEASQRPWASLVFLLPLVVLYEAGTRYLTAGASEGREQQIIAFILLKQFFSFLGATGRHMPLLALASILIAWHVARKDPWTLRWTTLFAMAMESVALALPVLLLGYAFSHYFPLAAAQTPVGDVLILSIGAGVYEELVFRLILLTFLSLILRDAFQMRPSIASLLMVVVSGVLFSAYHYLSPYDTFRLKTFLFRTAAGVYFAALMLLRGFGITAASHAAYDVLIVALAAAGE